MSQPTRAEAPLLEVRAKFYSTERAAVDAQGRVIKKLEGFGYASPIVTVSNNSGWLGSPTDQTATVKVRRKNGKPAEFAQLEADVGAAFAGEGLSLSAWTRWGTEFKEEVVVQTAKDAAKAAETAGKVALFAGGPILIIVGVLALLLYAGPLLGPLLARRSS